MAISEIRAAVVAMGILASASRRFVDSLVTWFSTRSPAVFRAWGMTLWAAGGSLIYAGWA